jgi:type III secretory pathway component EscS
MGVAVSIVQSSSQVQEQAFSFVLRLLAVGCALWLGADMMGERLHAFTLSVFDELLRHGP